MTDNDLIKRLDAAGKTPVHVPPGLMDRVLSDATAVQSAAHVASNVTPMRPRTTRQPARNWGWIGGAVLAASALLGLGVGYGETDSLLALPGLGDTLAGYATGLSSSIDEFGALNTFLAEG